MSQNKNWLPLVLLIILSVIWGSSFLLVKIGLEVLTPIQLAAIRIAISGLVFLPFVFSHIKKIKKEDLKFALLAGLLGNFFPAFLFASAQTHVDSSIAGALNATTPLFTLIIGGIFTSMVLNKSKILGVVIGLIGALCIVLGKSLQPLLSGEQAVFQFEGDVKYSLLVILATVFYGSNINLIKTKLSHYKAIVISTLPLFFVSIPSSIILAMSDWSNLNTVANSQIIRSVGAVVVLGLIGTSLGLYLFNRMIQLSGPVFSSSVTYFIPIVAVVLGFLDGERILWIQLGGMALILTGVYLLNRARSTEDSGQPAQSDG